MWLPWYFVIAFFLMQYDCFNVLATLVHIRIDNSAKPRHNIYILTKPFSLLQREFSFQHYQIPQVQMYNLSVMQYDLTCILIKCQILTLVLVYTYIHKSDYHFWVGSPLYSHTCSVPERSPPDTPVHSPHCLLGKQIPLKNHLYQKLLQIFLLFFHHFINLLIC